MAFKTNTKDEKERSTGFKGIVEKIEESDNGFSDHYGSYEDAEEWLYKKFGLAETYDADKKARLKELEVILLKEINEEIKEKDIDLGFLKDKTEMTSEEGKKKVFKARKLQELHLRKLERHRAIRRSKKWDRKFSVVTIKFNISKMKDGYQNFNFSPLILVESKFKACG